MSIDANSVLLYRTTNSVPNPTTDTLIGEDTSIAQGNWSLNTTNWSENIWFVYGHSEDLAGNLSFNSQLREIIVLPSPVKVAGNIGWTIGQLSSVFIGACN